jgi:hypothetical protein
MYNTSNLIDNVTLIHERNVQKHPIRLRISILSELIVLLQAPNTFTHIYLKQLAASQYAPTYLS